MILDYASEKGNEVDGSDLIAVFINLLTTEKQAKSWKSCYFIIQRNIIYHYKILIIVNVPYEYIFPDEKLKKKKFSTGYIRQRIEKFNTFIYPYL